MARLRARKPSNPFPKSLSSAEGENDHYSQPGNLYRLMDETQKKDLITNIVHSMKGIDGPKKDLTTDSSISV